MDFFESDRNEKKILLFIVLVALGIRLFLMVYLQTYVRDNDFDFAKETGSVAKAIASGEGFSSPFLHPTGPTALMPPVYPYFLALIFKVFGIYTAKSAFIALVFNCIISALTCIPLYYIAKIVFNRDMGYITAVVLALYPPSIWHAIDTIWDTTFFTFLAMIIVLWLYCLPQRLNLKNASLYGLFIGFVALVSPLIIIFYPVILVRLFLQYKSTFGKKVKYIAIIFLMALITITPWLIRNYVVFGRPMIRSGFGLELKLGNNLGVWDAIKFYGGDPSAYALMSWIRPSNIEDEYVRLGEVKYMDKRFDEAMTFIRENPGKFFWLTLRRFNNFWFGTHLIKSESLTWLKRLFFILPLPFMIAGIFLSFKRRLDVTPLIAFILLLPGIYYITHVLHRYRYPIEPIILIFVSYCFYSLIRWRGRASLF